MQTRTTEKLHRDADGNPHTGIPAVEQVVAVASVSDEHIVRFIPVIRPVFWPWVNETEPIPTVQKAGISAENQDGQIVNPKEMPWAKVLTKPVFRNAVSAIAASLFPCAVI
jgi:hypothetical protein